MTRSISSILMMLENVGRCWLPWPAQGDRPRGSRPRFARRAARSRLLASSGTSGGCGSEGDRPRQEAMGPPEYWKRFVEIVVEEFERWPTPASRIVARVQEFGDPGFI